jgi:hypothetical protein
MRRCVVVVVYSRQDHVFRLLLATLPAATPRARESLFFHDGDGVKLAARAGRPDNSSDRDGIIRGSRSCQRQRLGKASVVHHQSIPFPLLGRGRSMLWPNSRPFTDW